MKSKNLPTNAVNYIDEEFARFEELGIDLAIDIHGKLWLL
ncbi:YheC/YheD family protein [Natranaerobius trueperi]|nr:YheC/YheD family protein [Natranaerobius trueperi]